MSCNFRSASDQSLIADLSDLHHVVRYETVASLNELQSRFTLTDSALTHDQNAFTEYIHQNAVDADARSQFYLQPADDLCHQIRGRLLRNKAWYAVMVAACDHVFIRILVPRINQTRNLTGQKLIIHLHLAVMFHLTDILLLHIADNLDPLIVEMVKKTCQLQCRTIDIRMTQHNFLCIDLRCHVPEIHFFN